METVLQPPSPRPSPPGEGGGTDKLKLELQRFGAAELAGLLAALTVAPHPMLKLPTLEWVRALMATKPEDWKAELVAFLKKRQQRIRLAEEDPLWWGWEFEPWRDCDALLAGTYVARRRGSTALPDYRPAAADIVGIFGGNRASKTVYAVRRGLQSAVTYPGSILPIMAESEPSSVATVQKLAWQFLQPHFGPLNGKRDAVYKVNYSLANGFTDRKVVLPNRSEIYFLTYNQEVGDYEGWEFGAPAHVYTTVAAELKAAGKFVPPNIGAVADESLPLSWLKLYSRRLKFRRAKLLWTFTPIKGITPAIKEMVGNAAVTIESRPAELLPRQNFPDVPKGEMPYIRECVFPGVKAMAIYFFTRFNKFGPSPDRTYYEEVKALCEGKASDYIERVAYGMARDTVARAFPKFGPWNIVKRHQLPARGTNYFFTDPAGARNWASFWVRVTPGTQPSFYIYRDWPDAQTFGEWAVPTEREVNDTNRSGWDGDVGPAQAGMGMGIVKYKHTFLNAETIHSLKTVHWPQSTGHSQDPYHVRILALTHKGGTEIVEAHEEIAERYVDPRAGASEHMAEKGGTCIIDEFDEPQYDSKGTLIGPPMELIPASGVNEDEGLSAVNDLLDWNQEQPLMPVLNAPRLFVCEDCLQVIWTLENFTGRGGAKGACKDFADLLRYMALAKLVHVEAVQMGGRAGRGF
jgi:hypothetical protein